MNNPGQIPVNKEQGASFPPIIEPPKIDNQIEIPKAEQSTEEKLESVVAPTPQELDQKPVTANLETPKMAELSDQTIEPVTDIDKEKEAEKLIDSEPSKDLKGFADFSEKVGNYTDSL